MLFFGLVLFKNEKWLLKIDSGTMPALKFRFLFIDILNFSEKVWIFMLSERIYLSLWLVAYVIIGGMLKNTEQPA